jgi:hypothetical protein
MRVLVACEFSGVIRDAFTERGHDTRSCDILPTESFGKHFQCDIRHVLGMEWDLMIAHPPCTFLCTSGARWLNDPHYPNRKQDQQEAVDFFMLLMNADIPKIAVENPIGAMSRFYRKPDQIIQPYYFGDAMQKTTCLWLKNLPPLFHLDKPNLFGEKVTHCSTNNVTTKSNRQWSEWFYNTSCISDRKLRSHVRSKTFPGIAKAMAEQWG